MEGGLFIFKKIIISIIIIGVALIGTFIFTISRSYELPEVEANMKHEELGLDFSGEAELFRTEQLNKPISEWKELVREEPENLLYLNELRWAMNDDLDQYIDFLRSLNKESEEVYLQVSLAYIDKLQDKSLGTARLGQVSVLSINELNKLLEINDRHWLAHYARGVNNLYWPIGLKRIDKSIQDLAYCVAVAEEYEEMENPMWADAYVAYGDALVKKGEIDKGYRVWQDGFKKYSANKDLKDRVSAGKDDAFEKVKAIRGIDSFQRPEKDLTDLTMLWSGT